MDHKAKIRSEFEKQAGAFNDARHTIGSHEIMDWIVRTIQPFAADSVLDVAAGTALLGRALAKKVKKVTAIDTTPAMLEAAKKAADEDRLENIDFIDAEAEKLPFSDGEFDLVVSRLAVHHFLQVQPAISEMCRVCKTHGRVFVIDLISPADPILQQRYNDLERKRDPSHTKALTEDQLLTAFRQTNRNPVLKDIKVVEVDFKRWVELTKTPASVVEEIRQQLKKEIDGGEKSGFQPHMDDENLKFYQRWAIVEA